MIKSQLGIRWVSNKNANSKNNTNNKSFPLSKLLTLPPFLLNNSNKLNYNNYNNYKHSHFIIQWSHNISRWRKPASRMTSRTTIHHHKPSKWSLRTNNSDTLSLNPCTLNNTPNTPQLIIKIKFRRIKWSTRNNNTTNISKTNMNSNNKLLLINRINL